MDKDLGLCITRNVLRIHQDRIVQDIQGDVIKYMYQCKVLSHNEYLAIKSERDPRTEAFHLLQSLPLKGSRSLNIFLNYLSTHYSWIAEPLQDSITKEYNDVCPESVKHILTSGEVPQLSMKHVSRTEHAKKIKELIKKLEIGDFVVVYGMAGCGKSSLVVEALNDALITVQYLEGIVQWIPVGRDSDVGCIQTELLNRLNDQEQLVSIPLNTDYEATRRTLQQLWKQKKLSHGLLILDDVCCYEIIKYLNIGCKTVIITHDRSIMDEIVDSRINYVKVNEGFEEKETLNLFSKCLNVDCTLLPSYALKLHKVCKGFPLTISLIGAQLEMHQEDTLSNADRWIFYLEALSENTNEPFKYTRHSHIQFKSLEKAIVMCIQSLPDDLQNKYKDFALFVHDVNIKPEVLCVLWNLKKTEVENIMLELIHKSLVVRIWNQPLNSYVYSVHDLLLSNLKKLKSNQELKELHRKLIERYRTYCKGNFTMLPKNDNYIFLYFGYHLKNAGLLDEFPLWFLNLKFLESKICATGPADLLTDLTKYRKYIIVKSFYEKYVEEIEEFIKCIGPILYQTKGDIVQQGLLQPETSFIYKEAQSIAKSLDKPYFCYTFRASENCLPKPQISIVREKIETAIFGNRYDEVLIATESGSIKLWNIKFNKCLYTYYGHTKRVTHLMKNKLRDQFLSTSDDSTIRIWKMKSFPEFSEDSEPRTPSPETKQEHWQNAFSKNQYERPTDSTDCVFTLDNHTGPVIFAQFSSDGKLVVSTSTDKKIKIWKLNDIDRDGNLKNPKTINHTSVITKCYFMKNSPYDNLLYLTHSQTGSAIHGGEYPFEHFTVLLYLKHERVLSFFPLPSTDEGNEKVLVMTSNKVQCYQFSWTELKNIDEYPQQLSKQHYKFFSISEDYKGKQINSFRYLAFSLSNCTIQICNSLTGYNYLELNDPVHDILNLDWFLSEEDLSNWLLCAANDKSIRVWCLKNMMQYTCTSNTITKRQPNSEFKHIICKNEIISLQNYKLFSEKHNLYCYKLKQNFDAVWLTDGSLLIAAITQCGMLKILFEGLDQWSIIDKKVLALSVVHSDQKLDKTMIIVACADLSVYAMKFQASQHLFDSYKTVDRIFTFYDGDILVVATLLKYYFQKKDTGLFQIFEIWTNKNVIKSMIEVEQFLDCSVYRDKVIVLQKKDEIRILDIKYPEQTETKLIVGEGLLTNASLMIDCSTLALTYLGHLLRIFNVNVNCGIKKIDEYDLPFDAKELISISVSNNKQFIAIAGQQKIIVVIDVISKTVKHFATDPSVNIIQSIIWSSDDTRFAVKEVNQIILYEVILNRKIASVRLTAEKFLVDSILKKYIAINTAGNLVMLNLSKQ